MSKAAKTATVFVLSLSLVAWSSGSEFAQAGSLTVPKFEDCCKSYKEKKYAQALAQFRQLHNSGTCNEHIHYYMALCCQSLNQVAQARKEYEAVMKGKVPALKAYSQTALANLNRWSQHRAYEGNGNNFARYSSGSQFSGARSKVEAPLKEIIVDMPPPSGGGC